MEESDNLANLPMTDELLSQFLEDKVSGQASSSGQFTLNPTAALAKLGAHQLPRPGLWAVKMVQGAVARGCSRVEFVLTRSKLEMRCFGGRPISSQALLGLTLSGETSADRADRHWATGLRGAYGSRPRRMWWTSCADEQPEIAPLEEDRQATSVSSKLWQAAKPILSLTLTLEYETSWTSWSPSLAEYTALCEHCRLCPITVLVDRRLISRQPPDQAPGGYHEVVWTVRALPGEPRLAIHPGNLAHVPADATKPLLAEAWTREGLQECALLVCLSHAKQARARVYFLKDGALVGPYGIAHGAACLRLDIVCPGDHLETDVSEWNLRCPEEAFPSSAVLLAAGLIHRRLLIVHGPGAKKESVWDSWAYGVLDICTLGLLSLVLLPVALVAGAVKGATVPEKTLAEAVDALSQRHSLTLTAPTEG